MHKNYVVGFWLFFWMTGWVQAYEPHLHEQLSVEAVRQYQECFSDDKLLARYKSEFIKYSKLEDNVIHNPNRAREWHFFSIKGDLGYIGQGVKVSLNSRFAELQQNLVKFLKQPDLTEFEYLKIYETLGRLSHYVQDVTVPANVIPIYHWIGKKDKFSNYAFDFKTARQYFPANRNAICTDVKNSNVKDLFELLRSIARRTLFASEKESLKLSGKNQKTLNWSVFWIENPRCRVWVKRPFKDYGVFGNRFGDTNITDRCDSDEGQSPLLVYCRNGACKVDESSYKEFAARRHLEATVATQNLLYYLYLKLQSRQKENSATFQIER